MEGLVKGEETWKCMRMGRVKRGGEGGGGYREAGRKGGRELD